MRDRILVYGVTGSGKTVLCERISACTGIPWHSVDDLTWEPGWVQVPEDEQRRRIEAICAGERWVLDTAYGRWLDIPLARAELIVALDFPRWLVAVQTDPPQSRPGRSTGRPICNGNRESLRQPLLAGGRSSVWHFRSFERESAAGFAAEEEADPAAPDVLLLTSPRQAERWLAGAVGSRRGMA